MRKYTKLIIFASLFAVLVTLVVVFMVKDFDFVIFKNLSISSMLDKKEEVEALEEEEETSKQGYETAKTLLKTTRDGFDVQKEKYDNNIADEAKMYVIQQALVKEEYFIEYLWIVLGNYANDHGLILDILTPDSTNQNSPFKSEKDRIKVIVVGRYLNVADFVFDVENDKSLRFKLDNIYMDYAYDNTIRAKFDVISLNVLN